MIHFQPTFLIRFPTINSTNMAATRNLFRAFSYMTITNKPLGLVL